MRPGRNGNTRGRRGHPRSCGARLRRSGRSRRSLAWRTRFHRSRFGNDARRKRLTRSGQNLPRPVDRHISRRRRRGPRRRSRHGGRSGRRRRRGYGRDMGNGLNHRSCRNGWWWRSRVVNHGGWLSRVRHGFTMNRRASQRRTERRGNRPRGRSVMLNHRRRLSYGNLFVRRGACLGGTRHYRLGHV